MEVAGAKAQAASRLEGVFAEAGDNQHTLKGGSDIVRSSLKGASPSQGNSAAYLAARLKKAGRDDLLAEIGPSKRLKSVRAAAIEAGIVKPVPTIRLTDPARIARETTKPMPPRGPGFLTPRERWPSRARAQAGRKRG